MNVIFHFDAQSLCPLDEPLQIFKMGRSCECVGTCNCVCLPLKGEQGKTGEEGEKGENPEAKRQRLEEQEEVLKAEVALQGEWDWAPCSWDEVSEEEFWGIVIPPPSPEL